MMIDLRREMLICKQEDDLRRMNLETENMSREKSSLSYALVLSFWKCFFLLLSRNAVGTKVGEKGQKGVGRCYH